LVEFSADQKSLKIWDEEKQKKTKEEGKRRKRENLQKKVEEFL
jgi:hypothetical protein